MLSLLLLNIRQGSCEYQFYCFCFDLNGNWARVYHFSSRCCIYLTTHQFCCKKLDKAKNSILHTNWEYFWICWTFKCNLQQNNVLDISKTFWSVQSADLGFVFRYLCLPNAKLLWDGLNFSLDCVFLCIDLNICCTGRRFFIRANFVKT